MFGLIRLPILLVIAFVAGILYERSQTHESCDLAGGDMRRGLCTMRAQ